MKKPSKHFCETGDLDVGEIYNQNLHNWGKTPQERCAGFYDEYKVPRNANTNHNSIANHNSIPNHVAGKRYTRKMKKYSVKSGKRSFRKTTYKRSRRTQRRRR
jgi:hypothetical protein